MTNNICEKALKFATEAHQGQLRKGSKLPMITHPISVAKRLADAGFGEELIAAGYLHDVVEDTPVSLSEIKEVFGDRVALIVSYNTENKDDSWEERKQHTIDSIRTLPLEGKALIVADKLDNLLSIKNDLKNHGEKVWGIFVRGRNKQKWYFGSVAKNMYEGLSDLEIPQYFYEYEKLVKEVFQG